MSHVTGAGRCPPPRLTSINLGSGPLRAVQCRKEPDMRKVQVGRLARPFFTSVPGADLWA